MAPLTVSDEEETRADATGMQIALWARLEPDEPAVLSPAGNRSFADLNANVNRLVRALRRRGASAGDAIALLCSNRPEFVEVVYAALRMGLRFTPINWHLTAEEAAYIVNDCGAKVLVAEARFADVATKAAATAPAAGVRLAVGGEIDGFDAYDAALEGEDPADIDDPVLGSRMLYTSGTTGHPKGVARPPTYSHRKTATTLAAKYTPATGQLHLCTGPLYHAAPLAFSLLVPLNAGVGTVLMEKWDAEKALALIDEHAITHTHMVPTMFHRLLRLPAETRDEYDVSTLGYVIHGAAPCPVAVKKALIEWLGPVVWEYYAATEGSGSSVGSEEWLKRPGTVGKPPTPDHVRVLDDDGNELPPGEVGTIYLKMVKGQEFQYHGDPEKTQKARNGEHYTLGDVGYLDADGYLFLTDRSAHLIISGGVNIYPAEVEATLLQHPDVQDVGVIGVPNEEWGEEVKAVVELHAGVEATPELADAMIAFCREHLAHYKCPRSVDFVDVLPRHDNGKLYKRRLREQYRAAAAAT